MSSEQLDNIVKHVSTIENEFQKKLIDTGRARNADAVNRLSLIAAELISNEAISESMYALMQAGVGVDFSCNEMVRDNFKEQSGRYASKVYAHVYTFTGNNSIKNAQWERSAVSVSAVRNYENAGVPMEGVINGKSEISIQGEFKNEALIQDYYSGILEEVASRNDVMVEESANGAITLTLANGVEMEFIADGNGEVRGFKKKWQKVKTLVKENRPRVVGAVVFATGGLLALYANAIPGIGQILSYAGATCLMFSGANMMKNNEYYIGCEFKRNLDDSEK